MLCVVIAMQTSMLYDHSWFKVEIRAALSGLFRKVVVGNSISNLIGPAQLPLISGSDFVRNRGMAEVCQQIQYSTRL